MFSFLQRHDGRCYRWYCPVKHFENTSVLPLLVLGGVFVLLEWSGLDVWWSGYFYDAHAWPFKENWLIQKVLHKGGRLFFYTLLGLIVVLFLSTLVFGGRARRGLAYLFVANSSAPVIILLLKNHTHIYCPWDLVLFGGEKPYIRWFNSVEADLPGHCFSAAHAGSAYALVSLYFFIGRCVHVIGCGVCCLACA